jgi:hypothetical protein
MSRNFVVLGKAAPNHKIEPNTGVSPQGKTPAPATRYRELIARLFGSHTVLAIVGSPGQVAHGIAAELASSGERVVVVAVGRLLEMDAVTIPNESDFALGDAPNVWTWPCLEGQKLDFFKFREVSASGNWLDALRRNFDAVILDCLDVSEIAVMADAVVLVTEAGKTARKQVLQHRESLQLRGTEVAGLILVRRGE